MDQSPQIYLHKDEKSNKEKLFYAAAEQYVSSIGLQNVNLTLNKTKEGKPYFANMPEVHFSITHSADVWACAFSASPVGLDIQKYKPYEERIAERFFHKEEALFIKNAQNKEAAFFLVWAAKESFVKYTGAGITDAYREFSVIENMALKRQIFGVWLTRVELQEHCAGCICAKQPGYTIIPF